MILSTNNCPVFNRSIKQPRLSIDFTKGHIRVNESAAKMLDFDESGNKMSFEISECKLFIFWDMEKGFSFDYTAARRGFGFYNLTFARTIAKVFKAQDNSILKFAFEDFKDGRYELTPILSESRGKNKAISLI